MFQTIISDKKEIFKVEKNMKEPLFRDYIKQKYSNNANYEVTFTPENDIYNYCVKIKLIEGTISDIKKLSNDLDNLKFVTLKNDTTYKYYTYFLKLA